MLVKSARSFFSPFFGLEAGFFFPMNAYKESFVLLEQCELSSFF